jgi:hypothetical protein
MPITVAPDIIEQSDFSFGIDLTGADPTVDTSALLDDLNLILDPNTGSLVTRGGLSLDWTLNGISALASHYILQIFPWAAPTGSKLVVVVSNGANATDNVGLILVDLEANSWLRMDTAGVNWGDPLEHHWGVGMEGVWYGGTAEVDMYSFTLSGSVWNDAAGTPDVRELVDDVNDGVTIVTEYPRDYAFKGDETVEFDGAYYRPNRGIRYDEYDNDEKWYNVGDKVSRNFLWDTTNLYWKSFKCIKKHDPSVTADTEPGEGTDWRLYWTKVRLPLPNNTDDGNETSTSWYFVPVASQTPIGAWHANRLFLRFDDEGDRSRLQFSAPVKPEKGKDVPDVVFTPDFAPSNTVLGAGGGWLPFNDGTHHGFITALHSYGDRLIVFKRQAVWALVGTDDATWQTKRIIEGIGCVGPDAHVEQDGFVYFLSDEGLYVTDGQDAKEVPGNERVRVFIRTRLDESQFVQASEVRRNDQYPVMWKWDGFIWISMPSVETTAAKSVTLAYHPLTASWYYTNLPIRDVAVYRDAGRTHLAVALSPFYGEIDESGSYPKVCQYKAETTSDYNGNISAAAVDIAWRVRFAWWSFATLRQQRRIRRAWALVKAGAAQTITILARKDYADGTAKSTARAVTTSVVQHLEGEVFADCHAVNYELSGSKAPVTIHGVAVHTQRRRDMRYHSGPGPV